MTVDNFSIDTFLGIVGTIIGVVGLLLAYIFYRLSLRVKEPKWTEKANNLIQDNISELTGLEINYRNQRVNSLTVSKVLFWNSGKETISKDDLVELNHLCIVGIDGTNILSGEILATTSPSNNISLNFELESNKINIDFDYLDNNQGAAIQVVHTGVRENSLAILGDIKGVKNIKKYAPPKISWRGIRSGYAVIALFILALFPSLTVEYLNLLLLAYVLIDLLGSIIEKVNKKSPPYPEMFINYMQQ